MNVTVCAKNVSSNLSNVTGDKDVNVTRVPVVFVVLVLIIAAICVARLLGQKQHNGRKVVPQSNSLW